MPEPPSPAPIRADLAHAQTRRGQVRRAIWTAVALAAVLILAFLALWVWRLAFFDTPQVPDRAALWSLNRPAGVTFVDRTGQVVGQRGPLHGRPLSLAQMPPYLPKAFLAAEDRRFYSHGAVDPSGLFRALRNDLIPGRKHGLQGGSTITQQIARTLFLTPEQTLRRKLQEAVLATRIEQLMSKDDILALYLNRIYFGGGAYGVEAAAQTYFGKPATRLTLPESALLAALPKAPSHLSPTNDFADALHRSHLVLDAMQQMGWITAAQHRDALAAPPKLAMQSRSEGDFGYVLDLAAAAARGVNAANVPDLVVTVTVDPRLQAEATDAVRDEVAAGAPLGVTQGALVALAPDGAVLALVGGVDHRLSPFDRATQALRQPGSTFKPFVYAAALEAGLTPDDIRQDAPIDIKGWRPRNDDGVYRGAVTLSDALAHSINTVAVRVAQEAGFAKVAALARRFGLVNIPPHPAPPVALGAYEVTLLDLASAYQVFQSGGDKRAPYLIDRVTNARGDLIWRRNPPVPNPVYTPARAAEITTMMRGVIEHGTGRAADIGRPAAGKTGTTQTYRDAWFVGYTPDVLAGVWMGDDKGRPMDRVHGGDLPAEAWKRFMLAAEDEAPVRDFGATTPSLSPSRADTAEDARRAFYAALADQFDQAAAGVVPVETPGSDPQP